MGLLLRNFQYVYLIAGLSARRRVDGGHALGGTALQTPPAGDANATAWRFIGTGPKRVESARDVFANSLRTELWPGPFNPIELLFHPLKTWLRKAAERTMEGLHLSVGSYIRASSCGMHRLLQTFGVRTTMIGTRCSIGPFAFGPVSDWRLRQQGRSFDGAMANKKPRGKPGAFHKVSGSYHLCELYQSSTSFLAWSLA